MKIAKRAPLPVNYVEAKRRITECARVDECKDWADKAIALKSYARQAKDRDLHLKAERIMLRAIRQGGLLLVSLKRSKAGRRKIGRTDPTNLQKAIRDAGLSKDQANTMMRTARVDEEEFERDVESNHPPSAEQLAEMGTRKRKKEERDPNADVFIDWITAVRHLSSLPACGLEVLAGHWPHAIDDLLAECEQAIPNLKQWRKELEDQHGRKKQIRVA